MVLFFCILFILCLTYPISSSNIFSIQESLTILCDQFPLVSNINDSSLQCARLLAQQNVPSTSSDLVQPTGIILFIIIDQLFARTSSMNVIITFNQSSDSPSSINEIRLGLLVTQTNFTVNNQTSTIFTPNIIPIFHLNISSGNTYNLVDLLPLENQNYETDTSLCKWNADRWNRLFYGNVSSNISYVYFLKTTNSQLIFTLMDTSNQTSASSPPPPYLNILYCIPYKLGVTEIVLIACFSVFIIIIFIILGILYYFKGGEDNRTRHVEQYHPHRYTHVQFGRNHHKRIRRRPSPSASNAEQDEETSE